MYSSLVAVINALSQGRAAVCVSPPRVASVEFYPGGSYEDQPVQDFTCCMYSQPTCHTLCALISSSEFNDTVKLVLSEPHSKRTSSINRPRSIYQHSNMAPRLSGQISIFGVVFFVFKSLGD